MAYSMIAARFVRFDGGRPAVSAAARPLRQICLARRARRETARLRYRLPVFPYVQSGRSLRLALPGCPAATAGRIRARRAARLCRR
jgi:hypothetical protein